MRCRLCREKAVLREPKFCKNHFLNYYKKKIKYYLKQFPIVGKRILIGLSGGKDSAALASILNEVKHELGFEIGLFTINLGIGDYSKKSLLKVKELADMLDIELIVYNSKSEFKINNTNGKPCSPCGVIKRYLLNKIAFENNYDYVATGHNLDDEYFFLMSSLTKQNLVQISRHRKGLLSRIKFKLVGKLKPLYYFTEKENMIYCLIKGLPIYNQECPYSEGSPQLKFKLETKLTRQEKLNFMRSIHKIKKEDDFNPELNACKICGYPTTKKTCLYCRLT